MPASDKNYPGRPLNRSARVWNKLISNVDAPKKTPIKREFPDSGVDVQIRNDTGEDLPLGSAVAIDADGYILEWAEAHYYSFWFAGVMPAADSNTFAIVLQAIPQDEIGPARVVGRCMARVSFDDTDDLRAELTPGATYLTSIANLEGEGVKIIAKQAGTGLQTVPVILQPVQRCLPETLVVRVRATETALVQDLWYTYAPCDEYVPSTIIELRECEVPYAPPDDTPETWFNGPDSYTGWTGFDGEPDDSPWQKFDSAAYFIPDGHETSGDYCIELDFEIGGGGGYFQFDYIIDAALAAQGLGPLRCLLDGVEVFSESAAGGGTAGPFVVASGTHTLSFCIDYVNPETATYFAKVENVAIWGTV